MYCELKVYRMSVKVAHLLFLMCLIIPQALSNKLAQQSQKRSIDSASLVYDDNVNEGDGGCDKLKENGKIKIVVKAKNKGSSIAVKAAEEAKAASDAQLPAAENAAHQVKIQLADKAMAAAKAAEAAMIGKEQIVDQLESEVREGELVVREECSSLQSSQMNCNAAAQAAKVADLQLKTLTDAVKNAQCNVHNSDLAANGAQQELTEKQQLVEAAKKRVELLLRQLDAARSDYKSTKKASERASCAAREAKQRATRERRMTEIRFKLRRPQCIS